jgi:hypothetical protein
MATPNSPPQRLPLLEERRDAHGPNNGYFAQPNPSGFFSSNAHRLSLEATLVWETDQNFKVFTQP